MKKKILALSLIALMSIPLTGCMSQYAAKNAGGTHEVKLESNRKLINVTWKESDIWYLTREMRPDESADTYEFKESNVIGIKEGKIIIIETKN